MEGVLVGNWHRVMDQRLDAGRGEMRLKGVAPAAADDKEMIHVSGVALRRDFNRGVGQQTAVECGQLSSPLGGRAQSRQLRPKDRGLHLVEPRVYAARPVVVGP